MKDMIFYVPFEGHKYVWFGGTEFGGSFLHTFLFFVLLYGKLLNPQRLLFKGFCSSIHRVLSRLDLEVIRNCLQKERHMRS